MKSGLFAALTLLVAGAAFSQGSRGTIGGLVTDPTGANVVGARMVATEIRTGANR